MGDGLMAFKRTIAKRLAAAGAIMTVIVLTAAGEPSVYGQSPRPPGAAPTDPSSVTPAEIQRMFEAVALVHAQEALKLSDDVYLPFLAKYKALQDVRRRTRQQHARLIRELNRLTTAANSDEAQIKDQLKALHDLDARSDAELHKAYEAIDQVLDSRQQARFRVFEENMERRNLELVTKARLTNRQQNRKP